MILFTLLERYQLTNAFLFLNWLHIHQVKPRIIKDLLSLLSSILEQYFAVSTRCINIAINHTEVKVLDKGQIRKVIAAEGLESLLQPDLLINIYMYIGDINACIQLAESMGDYKAVILFKGFLKLNNSDVELIFQNLSFLNLDSFPSESSEEDLKELLELGRLYNENIINMVVYELTSSLEHIFISVNICINEECRTVWPCLHKTSYTWSKSLNSRISAHCKARLNIYQRYLWFMHFVRAAGLSPKSMHSKFPKIWGRIRHVASQMNLIIKFEKVVKKLYADEKLVAFRAEKILQIGLSLIKRTENSRDVIGLCLQKAMQELSAKKLKEYTQSMQDIVQSAELNVIKNGNDPMNTLAFNLRYHSQQGASTNNVKDPKNNSLNWEAEYVLEVNKNAFTDCKYKSLVPDKAESQKKGLFRNIPLSGTKRPDLIKYSTLWLEICSQVDYPFRSDIAWKFALIQYHWYNKVSNLPWRCPSHVISTMKLQPSTILKLFCNERIKLILNNSKKDTILKSCNTLLNKKIQCHDTSSPSITKLGKHQIKLQLVDDEHFPNEEKQLSGDPGLLKDFLKEEKYSSESIIIENKKSYRDKIDVIDVTDNSTKGNSKNESICDLVVCGDTRMADNIEKEVFLSAHNYDPDVELLKKSKDLHNFHLEDNVISDLDTLNDHIPSMDTFFVPSLPSAVNFTGTQDQESSMLSYEEKTSADFRFNANLDFPQDQSSDARNSYKIIDSIPALLQLEESCKSKSEIIQHFQFLIPGWAKFEQHKLLGSTEPMKEYEESPVQLLSNPWKRKNFTSEDKMPTNMRKESIKARERMHGNIKLSKNANIKKKDTKIAMAFGNFEISLQKFERSLQKKQNKYLQTLGQEGCLGAPFKIYPNKNKWADNFTRCSNYIHTDLVSMTDEAALSQGSQKTFTIAEHLHINETFIIDKPNMNDMDKTFIISSSSLSENLEETFAMGLDSEEIFDNG
jgi:hypothetical protein